MIMKKREIIFSFIFLILSYYIFVDPTFLSFEDNGEFILFILLMMGALYLTILNAIELMQYKHMDIRNRIINSFCFISSVIFITTAACSVIVK